MSKLGMMIERKRSKTEEKEADVEADLNKRG